MPNYEKAWKLKNSKKNLLFSMKPISSMDFRSANMRKLWKLIFKEILDVTTKHGSAAELKCCKLYKYFQNITKAAIKVFPLHVYSETRFWY